MDLTQLEQAVTQLSGNAYPLDSWQPTQVNTMDMVIKADGQWLHEGDPVTRDKLKVLFSKILRKEREHYYLVTPVEKIQIEVVDAPFLVIDFTIEGHGEQQVVWLLTNIGDKVPLSLAYDIDLRGEAQRPYLRLWRGLDALIERNTYYQLLDCAQEVANGSKTTLMINSQHQQFCLGEF